MNKLKIWILFCALLASASSWSESRSVIVNDAENVYTWSTPGIWSDSTPPVSGDSAYTIGGNGQISHLVIRPEDIEHTTNLVAMNVGCSGYSIWTTSTVEVAEGACLTVNGPFAVGTAGSTSTRSKSIFIVNGTFTNNAPDKTFRVGQGYTAPAETAPITAFVQNRGDVYVNVKYPSMCAWGTLKLLGGRFTNAGGGIDMSANSTFIVDGGEYVGGNFTACGNFKLLSGCIRAERDAVIGFISNGVNEPSPEVAVIGGGMMSNYYPRVTNGSLLMTNGALYASVLQMCPVVDKEANFLMTGGKIERGGKAELTFSDPGRARVLFAGGSVDLLRIYYNSFGDYCVTITNGSLNISDGQCLSARHAQCTNAMFCLRGTPTVTVYKNSLQNTNEAYSNRVHFAFEIDGRGLAPITASPTYQKSSKHYPDKLDIMSWHTLQPYGGFQLTTTNAFALFRNTKDMGFRMNDTQVRLPNADLWETGDLENDADGHSMFGSTLKESAKISVTRNAGWSQADGVPFGWFALPRLSGRTRSAKVLLGITAKGTNTLEGIVSNLRLGGYEVVVAESTSETVGTAEITLPLDRACSKRGEMRNILFDFTSYGTAYDVYEGKVTTNAVVTSAALNIKGTGLMLLCR